MLVKKQKMIQTIQRIFLYPSQESSKPTREPWSVKASSPDFNLGYN